MRTLLLASIMFMAASAQAATYDLTDAKILGRYTLEKADKKSELQKAELIYNVDNALVVTTDRNDTEYELTAPDKNGIVYEGDDEPNCDGEEERCMYDKHTVIKLTKMKVGGDEVPQLEIAITQSNAWDDEGKDDFTETWVLNWNKELDYAIPYFVNTEIPKALTKLTEECKQALKDLEFEDGAGYIGENEICPYAFSVQLREPFDKALQVYLKDSTSGSRSKPKALQVTPAELKAGVFDEARKLANAYTPANAQSPTRADVLDQLEKIEEYASKGDLIYTWRYIRDAVIVVVDKKTKIATRFNLNVTKQFNH